MDSKLLLALIILVLTQVTFADTCPTIKEIKSNKIAGWRAHDSESGKPLSRQRTANFIKSVDQFILAEWSNHGKERTFVHCFYRDKDGSDLEAYLTKNDLIPEHSKKWYRVSGAMQCAAGGAMCKFAQLSRQPTLAEK